MQRVPTSGGSIAVELRGEGPPLLLLHGFPQTRAMWKPVLEFLERDHTCILADLPGYGDSDPPSGPEHATKRVFAGQMIEMMAALGHERFDVAGHDRGGRVTYRMALDHPDSVERAAILDILPTSEYWARMDRSFALKIYHWAFLAQPYPLPETLIGGAPDHFLETKLASWTASKTLDCFEADAMDAYRRNVMDPVRLKAMCDDYRAGSALDVDHDLADRAAGKQIAAPTLIIWGDAGIAQSAETPLDVWREWCADVTGVAAPSGHFPCEEAPDETGRALSQFFS